MKTLEKIGTLEAIALVSIVCVNAIILNFPKTLIEKVGQSAWINIILASILVVVFLAIILKLYKPFEGNILSVAEFLFR